jgi:hypothetical protein
MKNLFFGSLIPLLLLTIHSIKHSNIFLLLYFIFYCLHLSGRPLYNVSVLQIYHIHRMLEILLLVHLYLPIKAFLILVLYYFLQAKVCFPCIYAFFTFLALPICNGIMMYLLNIIFIILLNFSIILFDLPPQRNDIEMYFYIRMAKNYILAFLLWLNSPLSLISLPMIVVVNIIYFYMVEEDEPIDHEYFINEIPSIYPIPLDIKDAVKYCNVAKTLFKKQAI